MLNIVFPNPFRIITDFFDSLITSNINRSVPRAADEINKVMNEVVKGINTKYESMYLSAKKYMLINAFLTGVVLFSLLTKPLLPYEYIVSGYLMYTVFVGVKFIFKYKLYRLHRFPDVIKNILSDFYEHACRIYKEGLKKYLGDEIYKKVYKEALNEINNSSAIEKIIIKILSTWTSEKIARAIAKKSRDNFMRGGFENIIKRLKKLAYKALPVVIIIFTLFIIRVFIPGGYFDNLMYIPIAIFEFIRGALV